ncbi:MAG: LpxL/LpxP family Kdo(2)-lipid IV(A) lauroyl/palmitoleoyl acyltransferase [Woeseiaceae bacterium]|nr:LpxL/LpxP family Kdo(2)-lipid IV(A) lauroyl/palmitoleoyl acyltransferase [Woeseiaceae bacterium]
MTERQPLTNFWTPRYWPTWLGMGLLRVLCWLPYRWALAVGRGIGRLAHGLGDSRRAIVRRNIELCFPELSTDERNALAKKHFEALGMSLIEMGLGRWASDDFHLRVGKLIGIEHLDKAVDDGNGVILLSAHFTTLEIMGRILALESPPFDAVYRKNRSAFITEIQRTGRERSADDTIEKRDIKKMVRNLRKGRPVWYAPDQSYYLKGSVIIEFFGVPTMHTTATSTLARLGKAVTLPFFPRRLPDNTWEFTIYPPLENFPSDDEVADTRQYVRVLEEHIRLCPEQYFWIHRKFKNLPPGYPDYYADLDALK